MRTNSEAIKLFMQWIIVSTVFGIVWGFYKSSVLAGLVGGVLFLVGLALIQSIQDRFGSQP